MNKSLKDKKQRGSPPLRKNKTVAFFDLDGTLIEGQSQMYLAKYLFRIGRVGFFSLLKILLWFVAYRIGFVRDPKKIMAESFVVVKGFPTRKIREILLDFHRNILCEKYNKEVIEEIDRHKEKGNEIVLLTNCVEPLARIVGENLKIKYVYATRLEVNNGVYTGKVNGNIVYAEEKAGIAEKFLKEGNFSGSCAYADHHSDASLFKIVKKAFLVRPSKKSFLFFETKYKKKNLKLF